jgi:hypothetical protein
MGEGGKKSSLSGNPPERHPRAGIKLFILSKPHASAWGYFGARASPKLTHGAVDVAFKDSLLWSAGVFPEQKRGARPGARRGPCADCGHVFFVLFQYLRSTDGDSVVDNNVYTYIR